MSGGTWRRVAVWSLALAAGSAAARGAPAPGVAAGAAGERSAGGAAGGVRPAAPADHTQPELIDLDGVAGIRAAFNADVGRTRLLLTFSPT